jgi:hypothetical protein
MTCLLSALLALAFSCAPVAASAQDSDKQRAQELWEQAVAAKGGRERLYAIRNVLVSDQADYKTQTFSLPFKVEGHKSKGKLRGVSLFVFPNKLWGCTDYMPGVFGLIMTMYNYESGIKYVLTLGDPQHPLEPIEPKETRQSRTYGLVSSFLETTWLKPVPVSANTGVVRGEKVDIVQTDLNGERIDFLFDRETHLPAQVKFYSTSRGRTYVAETLSDYVDVNGIKIAQSVLMDDGTKYKQTVQFNVEYDEDIFVKLPRFELGTEAWKKK